MQRHPVLEPFTVKARRLRNRAVVAPMSRVSTRGDGVPTANMARYYAEYADGGFGLVITEGTYTDAHYSQAYAKQPGIVTEQQQRGWAQVVQAVRAADARIVLQLMHAGALSQCLAVTAGPSAVQPRGEKMTAYGGTGSFAVPQAMSPTEIRAAVEGFAAGARRAVAAGFDGIEIHGANGYLIDQFITDYTNLRTDDYGGAIEHRITLAVEIIQAVRRAVPDDCIVGIRLSQGKVNDFEHRWSGGDGEILFPRMAAAGADYIHFASEGRGFDHGCLLADGTSLPRLARQLTGLPVIANGGLHQPAAAARILRDQHADLAALGSGALANPDWPRRLAAAASIRPYEPAMLAEGVTIEASWRWRGRRQAAAE